MSADVSSQPMVDHENTSDDTELAAALANAKLNAKQSKSVSRPNTTQHKCHKCGVSISGKYVLANGEYYDAHCFTCHTCNTLLAGQSYLIGNDNNTYCESDYYKLFNPRCGTCNEIIIGNYLSALNNKYHSTCFTCHICHQPFNDNAFNVHDNQPYCDTHYNELFAVKCYKCELPINDSVFEALGHSYHSACFTCSHDNHRMEAGRAFHVTDDKIYCQQHYTELICDKCDVCRQALIESYIKIGDKSMHSDCWRCDQCHIVLKSDTATTIARKFYCRPCGIEVQQSRRSSAAESRGTSSASSRPLSNHTIQQPVNTLHDDTTHTSNMIHTPSQTQAPLPTLAENDADTDATAKTSIVKSPVTKPIASKPAKSVNTVKSPKPAAKSDIKSPKSTAAPATVKSLKSTADTTSTIKSPKSTYADPLTTKYTYAELIDTNKKLNVDPSKREQYLSDAEFKTVFGMTVSEFSKLQPWKARMQKKDKKLF